MASKALVPADLSRRTALTAAATHGAGLGGALATNNSDYMDWSGQQYAAKKARMDAWNAKAAAKDLPRWDEYRRFDWTQPGSALHEMDMDTGRAAEVVDNILAYRRPQQTIGDYVAAANDSVPMSQQLTAASNFGSRLGRARENARRTKWLRGQGVTADSSEEEKAAGLDSYFREQQRKNQLPPRGVMSSLPGMIALSALGAAFGAPVMSALGNVGNFGAYLPAIKAATGAKTIADFVRAAP